MVQKLKRVAAAFAVYLSVCGLFGFSLFICEESIQTVMFSVWQSYDCQDWDTAYESTEIMAGFCSTMKVINYIGGWINPLAYISYSAYGKATDQYIKASRAKILAHAPRLFVDKPISFTLLSKSWEANADGSWQTNTGKILVLARKPLPVHSLVQGILVDKEGSLVLDLR